MFVWQQFFAFVILSEAKDLCILLAALRTPESS